MLAEVAGIGAGSNQLGGLGMQEYDLFVIGGGSGGVRAARMAAQRGARVALAEAGALGGTCVNLGCIPKKLYSYAAHYGEAFEESHGFGWHGEAPSFDWETLRRNRAIEIMRLNGVYEKLLIGAGVQLLHGRARLADEHTVELAGERLRAGHVLVATGGAPHPPEFPGHELAISSNEMFDLEPFPRRLLVIGGGYIACEFASIFNGLGSRVTQLHRGTQVLRGFDDDIRAFVAAEMAKKGVDIRLDAQVTSLQRGAGGLLARLADGSTLEVDAVLAATGRWPNAAGLGLEQAGVRTSERGAIVVDERFRTSVPHILAVGDVIDRVQLTPVALAEAMAVVDHLFGDGRRTVDYGNIPTAVFTHPNVGTVGLTEAQARERHGRLRIYRSEFKPLKHTLSMSGERTLMKLVVDDASDRVLGVHMAGVDAGEIVQGFAVALKAGATKAVFDATIGIHPTAAEEFVTMREPVA
jgi:glutathione reductase (NADPH)